jgi:hypothetical protein
MLHHPFTSTEQLQTVDGHSFDSYTAAWKYCQVHRTGHPEDHYGKRPDVPPPPLEQLFEETESSEPEVMDIQPPWGGLSVAVPTGGPGEKTTTVMEEAEDEDRIGERKVDREYDWM